MGIKLYDIRAPATVANFLKYVEDDYFSRAELYRVVTYADDNVSPKVEVVQWGSELSK